MTWDITTVTKQIEVESPDGEKASVTIRKLSEGDKQDILDIAAKHDGDLMPGQARQFILERAVTEWSVPIELSRDAIRNLPSPVADAIFESVIEFSPAVLSDEADPTTPPS